MRAFSNLSQLHLIRVELNTLQLVPLFEAIAKGNFEEVTLSAMDLSQVHLLSLKSISCFFCVCVKMLQSEG